MSSNDYHFITHWRIKGTVEEVAAIIDDATDLPRWWPSVYMEAERLKTGGENRIGEEIRLYTKGFLPYTLRWNFKRSEFIPPNRMVIEARGDFVGRGIWTFEQDGDYADVTYDWQIRADKPLLRRLSFLMKPIFSANHRWAMAQGLKSLELELARRHAKTDEERARIPAPPPPTPSAFVPFVLTALRPARSDPSSPNPFSHASG
jgi:hypothetical protein